MNRHHSTPQGLLRYVAVLCLLFIVGIGSSSAQLAVDVSYAPLTSLSVGDLDFKTFGSANWFFTLSISYPGTHRLQIDGSIEVHLADGTEITNPAATLTTEPFDITDQKTITNLDIGSTSSIKTKEFKFDDVNKDKLQDLALGTGKLPAGSYIFSITVSDPDNSSITPVTKTITLNLENISRLDLIAPQDGIAVASQFPFFQWFYDGDNVQFSLFEKRPQDQSKEDALSGTPMLALTTGDPGFPAGAKSLLYPSAGVRPLEVGKTYVWQVKGLTGGTGGVGASINSEIWQFTVDPSSSSTLYSSSTESGATGLTRILYLLPGMTQDLINQLLAGSFQLTGVILLDGVQVSAADVQAILALLAANPDRVIEISVIQ